MARHRRSSAGGLRAPVLLVLSFLLTGALVVPYGVGLTRRVTGTVTGAGVDALRRPVLTPHGTACQSTVESTVARLCTSGDTVHPVRTIAVVGDSKAGQYLDALDIIGRERHWQIVMITHSSCAWTAAMTTFRASTVPYTACHEWGRNALALLKNTVHPDALITSDRPNKGVVGNSTATSAAYAAIGRGMVTYWRALAATGTALVAIRETPEMGFDVPDCLKSTSGAASPDSECSTPRSEAIRSSSPLTSAVAAAREAGLEPTFIDLNDRICGSTTCEPELHGTVVYRDSHHLSDAFVRTLEPVLEKRLASVL